MGRMGLGAVRSALRSWISGELQDMVGTVTL
jgi:hypothetical protein